MFHAKRCKKGLYEYELSTNGLTLVLCPMPTAGSATFQVIYKVGSRNENATVTAGSTHILEHMLFKGSKKFHGPHQGMWHLEELGAYMNASTYLDRTNYYETIDASELHECIVREADRMANPILRAKDLKSELHVVHQEKERGDNSAFRLLMQAQSNTAFTRHSYRIPTIGFDDTVLNARVEALIKFHDQFYVPQNAVVTVVGSFDPEAVKAHVAEYFGPIPPGGDFSRFTSVEPPQLGEKRYTMHKGPFAILGMSWRGPKGLDQNALTLQVMGKMFEHPQSQFHSGVVEGKYHSIMVDWERMRDPYLFSLYAPMTVHTPAACARAEKHLRDVVSNYSFMAGDLEVAKQALRNEWAKERQSSQALSMALTEAVARGCAFDVVNKHEMLDAVTLKDLHHCLGYFTPDRLTVGTVLPGNLAQEPVPRAFKPSYGAWEEPRAAPRLAVGKVTRTQRGLYALYPSDRLHLRVHVPLACSHAQKVIMSHLVTKGVKLTRMAGMAGAGQATLRQLGDKEVNDFLGKKGVMRTVEALPDGLLYKVSVPLDRAREALDVVFSEVRSPLLAVDTLKELKYTLAAECAGKADNVNAVARSKFLQALFTKDSATYMPDFGAVSQEIRNLSTTDVALNPRATRVTCLAPENSYLRLAQSFEWGDEYPAARIQARSDPPQEVNAHVPGKTSVTVMYGCALPVGQTSKDYIPLKLAVGALGNGFAGRLMKTVRDKYGLTYGISASVVPNGDTSVFQVTATFAAEKVKLGVDRMQEVVEDWMRHGITKEELQVQQSMRCGGLCVSFDDPAGLADYLHNLNRTSQEVRELKAVKAEVAGVTLAQANAARQLIDLHKCTLVRAGTL